MIKNCIDYRTACAKNPRNNHGIGDQIVAFHVMSALKAKNSDKRIRLVVINQQTEWARLGWSDVAAQSDILEPAEEQLWQNDNEAWFKDDIEAEKMGLTRIEYTAHRFGVKDYLKPFKMEVSEFSKSKEFNMIEESKKKTNPNADRKKDRIILSPFATATTRCWPMRHWIRLWTLLDNAGYEPVTLASVRDVEPLKQMPGYLAIDRQPFEVAIAIANSRLVIGGDTGMTHLSSLVGVQAIVLQGPTNCNVIFNYYTPKPVVIASPTKCSPCQFVGKDIGLWCGRDCNALNDLQPLEVFNKVMEVLKMQDEMKKIESSFDDKKAS